jgi:hypothetical protein
VGKVTFKSNGIEALSNESLLKFNFDEELNNDFPFKSNGNDAFTAE